MVIVIKTDRIPSFANRHSSLLFFLRLFPYAVSIGIVVTGTGEFFKTLSVTLPKRKCPFSPWLAMTTKSTFSVSISFKISRAGSPPSPPAASTQMHESVHLLWGQSATISPGNGLRLWPQARKNEEARSSREGGLHRAWGELRALSGGAAPPLAEAGRLADPPRGTRGLA